MKGIKGERKHYGRVSPLHREFEAAGISYAGTRMSNGIQKSPWYIYETHKGEGLPEEELEALAMLLVKQGWTLDTGPDGDEPQPQRGDAYAKGQTYVSWKLRRDFPRTKELHTVQISGRFNDKQADKRNETHIDHITYKG